MTSLQWNPEVKLGDVLTLIGFVLTLTGLYFANVQLRRNTKVQRAQFLMDTTERYFSDVEVRKFYYRIDYKKFRFDPDKFMGSDEERWLDSLLYTFDVIGRMVKMGALTATEVEIFAFQASRVLRNSEVKKYLNLLNRDYEIEGRPTPAHEDALSLVETLFENSKLERSTAA
ncbi:MAG: hypothetical protein LC754_15700 [Acidobacteria bacterium]|nr:hypothetical protein [Acidobacteriota bacterium]